LRYAIISDIHSNLEALQAVLHVIEDLKIDQIICLGDVVGYGPDPNPCLELVMKNCATIITGNHDFACIDMAELENFTRYAKEAIEWTVTELSPESFQHLAGLPLTGAIENCFLVHANPGDPRSWDYILSLSDARYYFSQLQAEYQVCFIGHSHQPIIFMEQMGDNWPHYHINTGLQTVLQPQHRYIINVGSVGQPRDRNPAAAFGIIDTELKLFELKRVPYDVHKTYQKIIAAGLPSFLADRLLIGR